ncbi:MAG: asparagine synthase-related protein [Xanthomonadales bacterium]|jgi:asparagine synthase (glutamine-hydrolysing)|nr:asparagine synthase-related protein [Xanthomonadales bacterium]
MCGFAGRIAIRRPMVPAVMAAPLLRRGPDGWHHWNDQGVVELLHTRLAIVDPDPRARQPMLSGDGAHALAFNGEVYNYRVLRQQLSAWNWVSDSDTEVLLAGLALHGSDFLTRARGMFAGAWVDRHRQEVHLFRDPVGKKPLLVWPQPDGEILFGSSLAALQVMCHTTPQWRIEALREVLHEGYIEPPGGLYAGVEHLLPGEHRVYDYAGHLKRREHLEPLHDVARYAGEPSAEVDRTVSRLLEQAVARRLENNPEPAALLSGGIDSTLICQIAARQLAARGQGLRVYSLKPFVPGTHDEPWAREAARRIGLDIQWVRLPTRNLVDRILIAIDAMDEPLALIAFINLWELVRTVGVHSRVLLTGDGGDELFLGYGTPEDWQHKPTTLPNRIVPGAALPAWFGPWARRSAGSDLFGHGFQKVDRASAEQGIEIRCPLLDYDLGAYLRSLPATELLRGGRMKALAKAQLLGFPERFLERRKLGITYNLRWQWLFSRFAGLREHIDPEVHAALLAELPEGLRRAPAVWSTRQIHQHFQSAFALLVLSRCLRRRLPRPA